MAANDNDARRYARRSAGAMRVPEWRGEPGGELDDVKYGEGFRARQSNSRDNYAEVNDYEYETRRRNIDTEANGEPARDYGGRTAPRDGSSTRARSAQSRDDEYRRRAPVRDDYEREPDYADERGTARTRRAARDYDDCSARRANPRAAAYDERDDYSERRTNPRSPAYDERDDYSKRRTNPRSPAYDERDYANRDYDNRDYDEQDYDDQDYDERDYDEQQNYSSRPGRKPRRRANPRAALDRLSGIAGRIARHAAPRDDTRPAYYTDPRKDAPEAEESVVYGGRDHDNIPSADMRPNIGKKPLIGLCALLMVLLVAVPLMMRGVTRVNLYDDKSVRPAAAISLQSQTAATAAPTDQPSQQPTAEPTISPGMMVSQYTGRTLDKTRPAVALTFDDGPSNQTGRILDALEKDGGLATFFLVGDRVEKYAETAQREYASGCLVGTHMYSHTKLTDMTAAEVENELNQCSAIHLSVIGAQPSVARPPYGSTNATVREAVNLPLINWSLNSNDWETRDADRIYNDVMNNIQDGDIVLFHDLKDFSASAIERIVPALTKQGYQLVTVQELFELKGRTLEPGVVYSSRVTAEE